MNEAQLLHECQRLGVHVAYLPYHLAGAYFHAQSLIIVNARLSNRHQLEALAHEYVHALCGHDGAQSASVERRVNRHAARLLIDEDAYRRAELLHHGCVGAIASELDVSVRVVERFQEGLRNREWVQ